MADDERRAEIEAVARVLAAGDGYAWDSIMPLPKADTYREKAEFVIETLDRVRWNPQTAARVRDARGDDDAAMADISAEREQQIADGVALDDEAKCCCDCGVGFGEKHNPMCGRVSIFHSTVTAEDVYARSPGEMTMRARDSQDRCPEHPTVGDPSCRDCQIESHDAWMHRAKAAEARLAELEEVRRDG